jgi:hypothetical protein
MRVVWPCNLPDGVSPSQFMKLGYLFLFLFFHFPYPGGITDADAQFAQVLNSSILGKQTDVAPFSQAVIMENVSFRLPRASFDFRTI